VNNLQRRASGIWVVRLVVPKTLRKSVGRREFIRSTGTHNATIAKLVASAVLLDWRRQLAALQLAQGQLKDMSEDVVRLVEGSPLLAHDGTVSLPDVERLSGIPIDDLLRAADRGELKLFARAKRLTGFIVPIEALHVDNPELGRSAGLIVPGPRQMPGSAVPVVHDGVLALDESPAVASELLATAGASVRVLTLEAPDRPGWLFVPEHHFVVTRSSLEVQARAADALRRKIADTIPPERLERARALREAAVHARATTSGKMAARPFSEAVEVYCSRPDGLPGSLGSVLEVGQRRNGLLLFAEFMGDADLGTIDGDMLRKFRDGPLKRLPAHANRLPKAVRRGTMKETLEALEADGRKWPLMTADMQRERMRWLYRFFAWLHDKGYLKPDPAAPLRGETGMTKAQQKAESRRASSASGSGVGGDRDDDEVGRGPFTAVQLQSIFSVPHYQTGDGRHVRQRNRVWYPFEYWLPLLGIYAGCRIKEACQLHLTDVKEVDRIWCLDINERTADKTLKNQQSKRLVPLHRQLLNMGFLAYCESLRASGYRRVFPELSYVNTDARYAKEAIRKMSTMLESLGMPRDNTLVFHCLRHNANNALMRVPLSTLPFDEHLRTFIRYRLLGHKPGDDVNVMHYTDASVGEAAALVNAISFELPEIKPFDIAYGVAQVKIALDRKQGDRKGKEDMGPSVSPEPA
jgi:integrase